MRKRRPHKRVGRKPSVRCDRRLLTIDDLSPEGEGMAGDIRVPFGLPGEVLSVDVSGQRGRIVEVITPSPDRHPPCCPHFGAPAEACGGCTLQHLGASSALSLKKRRLLHAVRRVYPDAELAVTYPATARSRRRAKFAVERGKAGFRALASHRLVPLTACDVLHPDLLALVEPLGNLEERLGRRFDAQVTLTDTGCDVALFDVGEGDLTLAHRAQLSAFAEACDLARLSADGVVQAERRIPQVRLGGVSVDLPAGAFLQATEEGQAALIDEVLNGFDLIQAAGLKRTPSATALNIIDFFAGLGTFALPLSRYGSVHAVDGAQASLQALLAAARRASRPVTVETRDLWARPLQAKELGRFDAAVFDPARAGAGPQAQALADAGLALVVAVSCHPATMARDLKPFAVGYDLERLAMVDQFGWSAHVEAVAVLRRR